jgi:phosphoglycolate phosphatase-like HAD superfamily hydrolase
MGARAAGSPSVALATTHAVEELRQYSPDLIIRDFTELDITELHSLKPKPA